MKIEIFEDDGYNTLSFEDKYAEFTIDIYPDSKTYQSRMSLKNDVYYRTETFEYRIQNNPLKVETRLIERVDEPPEEYSVKDGVVLESDILGKKGLITDEFTDNLKKEVLWHQDWEGNPISMYLLSKHPEVISPDEYRRHLRLFAEKIKTGILKVEKYLLSNQAGLHIIDDYMSSGREIWYSKETQDSMSKEEMRKAVEHVRDVKEKLFDDKSKDYVGISEYDFRLSKEVLEYIDVFLNKKLNSTRKDMELKNSKTMSLIISLIITLLLSWLVSWFVDMNAFLIFIIVQFIVFAQSIIGGWIERITK